MDTKQFGDNEVRLPTDPGAKAEETMNEMKREVGSYVNKANQYVDQTKEKAKELGHEAKERATDVMSDLRVQGNKMADQVREKCKDLDVYARENPWHVAGVAAAIGALAAILLCRSSRRCSDE